MKRNYLKQNIAWTMFVSVTLSGMLWGGIAYAQEGDVPQMVEPTAGTLTGEQKQALAEIMSELEEVESELMRLSLAVTKLALEEQVLALEQQIALAQAVDMDVEVKDTGIAMDKERAEELVEEDSAVVVSEGGEEESQERSQAISTQVDAREKDENENEAEEDEEDRGFLAALGPLGNLGKPELAVLAILGILAVFILVRRLRGRKQSHSPVSNIPMRAQEQSPLSPQQPFGQSGQGTFQEGRPEA